MNLRSSHSEVFLGKGFLKICSKFTGKHPCQIAILIKLLCSFIEITLRHGCSPLNLLHIFRATFLRNTSEWLLLKIVKCEVVNVEFLSRDLPLKNIEIMVKWKCLKLLYSSKGMCRIDSQLKKMICLKYLILETL